MVRGPVSLAIVTVITLIMFALVSGGPKVFERVLPESAIAWLDGFGMGTTMEGFGSFGGSGGKPKDGANANAYLKDTHEGWKASDEVTTLAGMELAFVDQVIAGYSRRITDAVPGTVEVLTEQTGCAFTPPSAEAHIGLATVAERTQIGLATYNDTHIAQAVQQLAVVYRSEGKIKKATLDGVSFEVADIAVTETAKPVYLILDGSYRRMVFNIHLAPNAKLERVVLIGGIEAGVANVDTSVPVEVITDEAAAVCGLQAYYPLNPGHRFFEAIAEGHMSQDDIDLRYKQFKEMAERWEAGFFTAFGVSPAGLTTGSVDEVSLATIGPVPAIPEGRAVWKTIRDAPVRITVDQYVEKPGAEDGRDFDAVVKAVAKSFAWGNLENMSNGVNF